jgi:hypothetical protein
MNPPFPIRRALLTEREALSPLFEELDEHHRSARPDIFRHPAGALFPQSADRGTRQHDTRRGRWGRAPRPCGSHHEIHPCVYGALRATICGTRPTDRSDQRPPPRHRPILDDRVEGLGSEPGCPQPRGVRMVIQCRRRRILSQGWIPADSRTVGDAFYIMSSNTHVGPRRRARAASGRCSVDSASRREIQLPEAATLGPRGPAWPRGGSRSTRTAPFPPERTHAPPTFALNRSRAS